MRKLTQIEYRQWMELARRHGYISDEGDVALGRFATEPQADGALALRFITPLLAGERTTDLQRKSPPIMFDRTATGEIILPGRWWQHILELLAEGETIPDDIRGDAARAAHYVHADDVHLPADTDTIEMDAPDEDGNVVTHEALPPGGLITLRLLHEGSNTEPSA
jgi:hypothetical protein